MLMIATESTIRSGLYPQLLTELDPAIRTFGKACPLLVPLVEEGWTKDPVTEEVARRYLDELLQNDIDTLIMGCTHYPLLRGLLGGIVGDAVTLINPAYETALALDRLLGEQDLRCEGGAEAEQYRFFASDTAEKFNAFANLILPYDIEKTELVEIEKY